MPLINGWHFEYFKISVRKKVNKKGSTMYPILRPKHDRFISYRTQPYEEGLSQPFFPLTIPAF